MRDVVNDLRNNIAGNFLDSSPAYWAPAAFFFKQFLGAFIAAHLVRDVAMNQASIPWFGATQQAGHLGNRNKTLNGQAATSWWWVITACRPS